MIPPVGGRNTPLALLRGLFAGGFFQWVEELGRRDDCSREDSSSDWKDWDVGIADYVRFARVLHMRRAMVGLLFRAFVAFHFLNTKYSV